MSSSPPALAAAYQACLNEALQDAPLLIEHWYARLLDILYERSTSPSVLTEKRLMQDALVALKTHRATIEQGFAPALSKAVTADAQAGTLTNGASATRALSALRFDELELMGDAQVQEKLDGARLHQVLRLASDSGMADFSARLSTAQGYKVVKIDKNPLRPEVFSQVLLALLQSLPVSSELRSRWLVHGAQPMGDELQKLYVRLSNQLQQQGIGPAAYGVISSPEAQIRRPLSSSASSAPSPARAASAAPLVQATADVQAMPAQPASDPAAPAPLLTLDHLHRLMVGDYDNAASADPYTSIFSALESEHRDFSHTVPAAMDLLIELEQKALAAAAEKRPRSASPQPVAMIREQLKTEARSLGQSLAIEVVGLMIEQLLADSRLLGPVRQVIAHIEPAFLRLALTDPRFFSDKLHPARRLLEVITASSLAFAHENAAGFASFMQNLQAVAGELSAPHGEMEPDFAVVLQDFERRQASQGQESTQAQNRAVQALLHAEQRNLLAEKIAAEIRQRPDFVSGNRIISSFLTGPWAQVMAKERLLGEHAGLGASKAVFSLTLGDVLWSLDLAQASRHRSRLVRIIPDLLGALREGLLTIDYPLAQSKAFFDEMMAIHRLALQAEALPRDATLADGRSQIRAELDQAFDAAHQASYEQGRAQLWLAPTEAQQSGFMDSGMGQSQTGYVQTLAGPTGHDGELQAQPLIGDERVQLPLGAWVELLSGASWLRAQLTWISPHNSLFMFTSEGGRSHSMTARMLQQLLALERVKLVSQQGVLTGALDGVARAALRNSMDERAQ